MKTCKSNELQWFEEKVAILTLFIGKYLSALITTVDDNVMRNLPLHKNKIGYY